MLPQTGKTKGLVVSQPDVIRLLLAVDFLPFIETIGNN
jgi:hypothetical protein